MADQEELRLLPDPDQRRVRENMKRIEEYLRKRLAAEVKAQNSTRQKQFLMGT